MGSRVGEADWWAFPKAELHVRLRGAMPPAPFANLLSRASGDLVRRFTPRHRTLFLSQANIRPFLVPRGWSAEEVAPLFDFSTCDQFLVTFAFTGFVINGPADFERLARGVLAALVADGIVYAAVTVSAREYARWGVPLPALLAVLDDAARRAPLRVQWIIDLVRDLRVEAAQKLVAVLDRWRPPSVVGITMGGSEHRFPPRAVVPVYRAAWAAGLRLSAHAGEGLGPESVPVRGPRQPPAARTRGAWGAREHEQRRPRFLRDVAVGGVCGAGARWPAAAQAGGTGA